MLRLATADDDLPLGALQVAAYRHQFGLKLPDHIMAPNRLADLRNSADKREHGTVFVVERDERIVGTVSVFRFGAPRSEAWIEGAATLRYLAVAPAYQGQGVSQSLLDEAERQAMAWNAPAVCLHVRRECEGVARVYRSRGYQRDARGDQDRRPQVFLEGYARHFQG